MMCDTGSLRLPIKAFSERTLRQDLKKFNVPTLILHATTIRSCRSARLRSASRVLKGATLKVYPVAMLDPKDQIKVVVEFFKAPRHTAAAYAETAAVDGTLRMVAASRKLFETSTSSGTSLPICA